MPVYEYLCQHCNGIFEVLRSRRESSEPAPCPVCDRDAQRIMPSSFAAFTVRDGLPRRIPDRGTYWHLGKEVKKPITGEGVAWEHPEINRPKPPRTLSKRERGDVAEYERLKDR
jgi:putative FmdB family regulatory protein